MAYMQGFNLTETKIQQRKQVNKLKKYTNGFINQDISYNFTIESSLFSKIIFHLKILMLPYNVKYQTDLGVGGIQQQTIYLSGVSITNWGNITRRNIFGKGECTRNML